MLLIKHKQHVPVAVWAHWISNHSYFKNLIVVLIIANALLLGVETELAVDDDPQNRAAIQLLGMLENISLVIFVLEIVIKMYARTPPLPRREPPRAHIPRPRDPLGSSSPRPPRYRSLDAR